MLRGLHAIKDCEFRPSRISFNKWTKGNVQTILTVYRGMRFDGRFEYDHREVMKLKDGGTIHIDCKGEQF